MIVGQSIIIQAYLLCVEIPQVVGVLENNKERLVHIKIENIHLALAAQLLYGVVHIRSVHLRYFTNCRKKIAIIVIESHIEYGTLEQVIITVAQKIK